VKKKSGEDYVAVKIVGNFHFEQTIIIPESVYNKIYAMDNEEGEKVEAIYELLGKRRIMAGMVCNEESNIESFEEVSLKPTPSRGVEIDRD
jgi:predicted CopG family antitoxin